MDKKNLIIGAYSNYDYNQLKVWVESAQENAVNTDIVLIAFNTTQETVDKLKEKGVEVVVAKSSQNIPIHVERFIYIYDFLKNNMDKYIYVITTDVKDVYFQKNPFGTGSILNCGLIAGTEGLKYKDEPWGNQNIYQALGPYFYEELKDKEIYNVGVFGGQLGYVKDMCLLIFQMSLNRPIPIVDQAIFNFLLNNYYFFGKVYRTTHDDSFVCHLGTTADPTKIENFRQNLLCREPKFESNQITNQNGFPYFIVHQYDRVPEIKKYVFEKYNVENEAPKFIYRSE